MKKVISYILLIMVTVLFVACASENDDPVDPENPNNENIYQQIPGRRTIIAYITADNNIDKELSGDITEMIEGSKSMPEDCRLLIFADIKGQMPYIAHIDNGTLKKVKEYDNDFYSTSPDSMRNIFQWIIDNYPSSEYGAVIEGHGTGPLIRTDTVASRLVSLHAYGYDATGEESATSTNKWMNIPSMATALNNVKDSNGNPLKLSFIFFDCCCFQTAEVAYELRHTADYIIAPVCETPGEGANYKNMVPVLCENDAGITAKDIVNTYANESELCISAVRTDKMDALCNATKTALQEIHTTTESPLELSKNKCIYYYKNNESAGIPVLCDLKHVIKTNASTETYNKWLPYLEDAVIVKHRVAQWTTSVSININFYSFREYMTDDNYGGMSMIIPDEAYNYGSNINTTMFQLEWCRNVGWRQFGW